MECLWGCRNCDLRSCFKLMWKNCWPALRRGAARKDDVEGVVDSDSFVLKISSSAAVWCLQRSPPLTPPRLSPSVCMRHQKTFFEFILLSCHTNVLNYWRLRNFPRNGSERSCAVSNFRFYCDMEDISTFFLQQQKLLCANTKSQDEWPLLLNIPCAVRPTPG